MTTPYRNYLSSLWILF